MGVVAVPVRGTVSDVIILWSRKLAFKHKMHAALRAISRFGLAHFRMHRTSIDYTLLRRVRIGSLVHVSASNVFGFLKSLWVSGQRVEPRSAAEYAGSAPQGSLDTAFDSLLIGKIPMVRYILLYFVQ
jgi:hypothetical protein